MRYTNNYMQRLVIATIVILSFVYFAARIWQRRDPSLAIDFAVNWIAAKGLLQGLSLYDWQSLRELNYKLLNTEDRFTYFYASYISTPIVAIITVPFAKLPFADGLALFKVVTLFSFVTAVLLVILSLPPADRKIGCFVGIVSLFTFTSVAGTINVGQINALVMLAIATAIFFIGRNKWDIAGLALGVAALLKISPTLLIIHCILYRRWQAVIFSFIPLGTLLVLFPHDLVTFILGVSPVLASGTLHVINQSLPAWFARLIGTQHNFLSFEVELGVFRWISFFLGVMTLAGMWWLRSQDRPNSLEFGALILAALLIGPLTWDHYTSWAIIPLIQVTDHSFWYDMGRQQRLGLVVLLVVGALLLAVPVPYNVVFTEPAVATHWWLRLASGVKTIGVIFCLAAVLVLLKMRRDNSILSICPPSRPVLDRHLLR
jgi:hypothetical protein